MSRSSLLHELERAESVLNVLLERLSDLNAALEPIERSMRVSDFSSSGVFVQGASRGVVCVLSGLIQGDPLERVLSNLKGRGIPTLIKSSDRTESQSTVASIVNMVTAEDQKKHVEYIVNLRWSEFPRPIERENVAILGTRYLKGDVTLLRKMIESLGVVVLEDAGEFGGGPLVSELIRTFEKRSDQLILELTISHGLSENIPLLIRILNIIAGF
ncbi:MAG: hypothetical protein ACFFF9_06425 [Candidatus Thorarchaeota archaeon]